MKNSYKVKTDVFGVDYIEMISPDGTISFVPMVVGNADYQAYLRWLENPDAEEGGTL